MTVNLAKPLTFFEIQPRCVVGMEVWGGCGSDLRGSTPANDGVRRDHSRRSASRTCHPPRPRSGRATAPPSGEHDPKHPSRVRTYPADGNLGYVQVRPRALHGR